MFWMVNPFILFCIVTGREAHGNAEFLPIFGLGGSLGQRLFHPLEGLLQRGARTAEVQAQEVFSACAKGCAVVQGHPGIFKEKCVGIAADFPTLDQSAAIEPGR